MNGVRAACLLPGFLPGLLLVCAAGGVRAADAVPAKALAQALPPEQWRQVENSVNRGLAWLATQQAPDGSFPTLATGQPAITSLCVMAFLSRGHQPGFGPYGQLLNRAIDYVLSCQQDDGLLCYLAPEPQFKDRGHAIRGLTIMPSPV